MNITLNNIEIEEALIAHISAKGLSLEGKTIEVHLTVGRGVNGHSASIAIMDKTEPTGDNTSEPADEKLVFS